MRRACCRFRLFAMTVVTAVLACAFAIAVHVQQRQDRVSEIGLQFRDAMLDSNYPEPDEVSLIQLIATPEQYQGQVRPRNGVPTG
jgi:HAMP domain-containing protein